MENFSNSQNNSNNTSNLQQTDLNKSDEYLRYFFKCLGTFVVILELFFWVCAIITVLIYQVPYIFQDQILFDIVFTIFLVNLYLTTFRSFFFSVMKSSNTHQNQQDQMTMTINNQQQQQSQQPSQGEQQNRYCKNCYILKDVDVHHCSICNRCINRLDHHCMWVNNCIGEQNYRFFLSYIFNTLLCTIVHIIILDKPIKLIFEVKFDEIQGPGWMLVVGYFASLLGQIFTGILLLQHLFFILNDVRTLEVRYALKNRKYSVLKIVKHILRIQKEGSFQFKADFFKSWDKIFFNKCIASIFWPKNRVTLKIDYELDELGKSQNEMI